MLAAAARSLLQARFSYAHVSCGPGEARCKVHHAQLRSVLIVPASKLEGLWAHTSSHGIYDNHALIRRSSKSRGELVASIVRQSMAIWKPDAVVEDAGDRFCDMSGRQLRGKSQAEYDWKADGRRVECKSSIMTWEHPNEVWKFHFFGIKLPVLPVRNQAAFDDLMLALVSPAGIYVYMHDHQYRISSSGKVTTSRGFSMRLTAKRRCSCWRVALDSMLNKLDSGTNGCQRLAYMPLDHPLILQELQGQGSRQPEDIYQGLPLSDSARRGFIIQDVVRAVDSLLHPSALIEDAIPGTCVNGRLRSSHNAPYDWVRNGTRIECKSAKLLWSSGRNCWTFGFAGVKFGHHLFDELYLALYTPRGIYIYRHDFQLGVSRAGIRQTTEGHCVILSAKRGTEQWAGALDEILGKLDASLCRQLAHIEFT